MIGFEKFIDNFGFIEYPFSIYTTENERGKEDELFMPPSNYSPIISNFAQKISLILIGDRGTGKTAILLDFERRVQSDKTILCKIDDFSSLDKEFTNEQFYGFVLQKVLIELFSNIAEAPKVIKKLEKDEKILLSYFLKEFVPTVSKKLIKERIAAIQVPKYKRVFLKTYGYIRGLLNYGVTVGSNIVENAIYKHFNMLPYIENDAIVREYFPELPEITDTSFNTVKVDYQCLVNFFDIIKKLGFDRTIMLLDKLDEDNRLENNGEEIANFVKPILTDNKFLLNDSVQIVISMWSTPFNYLVEHVRTQKHYCPKLDWRKDDLVRVLNRRIQTYSNNKIKNYRDLFEADFSEENYNSIFELANSNPRDLWHIFDRLMRTQNRLDPTKNRIENASVNEALIDFIQKFNYFEYYPRKKNARSNTMDFYSYTAHLLKLEKPEFTRNQFNERAKTGGSTLNYVVGMERIGLVKKKSQEGGVTRYLINDPKVVYALERGIKIER